MENLLFNDKPHVPKGHWDVIVAGGGLGGVCAAIASARSGAKTLLVERNTYVGGVATAGMCCSIFNCFYTSRKKLASLGLPVEIADRLATATGYGNKWHNHKGHIIFDLEKGKLVLQQMLEEAGVDILLGHYVAGACVEDNVLKGIVIEGKNGSELLTAACFVDATGDADLAYQAGVPLHTNSKEKPGIHSLCFRIGNVDVDSFVGYFREHPDEYAAMMDVEWTLEEALKQYDECSTFLFPHGGGRHMRAFQKAAEAGELPEKIGIHDTTNACQMHALKYTGMVHVITGFVHFDGLDSDLISQAVNDGRKMAFVITDVYKKYIPGFSKAFVAGVADNLGVRTSRWLNGDFIFKNEMRSAGTRFEDAVGKLVPFREEKRYPGKDAWCVQVMEEDTFDLPFRCLLPRKINGILMGAGRSISAEDPGTLRAMVYTMSVGQAAGAAAAVSAKNAVFPRSVDVAEVRKALILIGDKNLED